MLSMKVRALQQELDLASSRIVQLQREVGEAKQSGKRLKVEYKSKLQNLENQFNKCRSQLKAKEVIVNQMQERLSNESMKERTK